MQPGTKKSRQTWKNMYIDQQKLNTSQLKRFFLSSISMNRRGFV